MQQPPRTVLIVDDSPEDRELYRRYLQRDPDYSYTILEASLGRQGLELWQQQRPDLVLLDYRLPDLDGLEFLAQLPSPIPQPCLPVIVMTGQGNETIAVQAMKAGAQDYLVKGQLTPEGLHLAIRGSIETVQLRTELHQRIERERVVGHITRQIHQSLDLERILQTAVTEVRQFLNTDRVLVFQLQPDGNGRVVAESVGSAWRSLLSLAIHDPCLAEHYLRFSRSGSISQDSEFAEDYVKRYRQGQVTAIPDIHGSDIDPCHIELLTQFQVNANLVVPILHDDLFWGLLIAHHCVAPRLWQPLEIDLLKELATQLGIALRQAELYQQSQTELAERKRAEAALQASEARFRLALEATGTLYWERDLRTDQLLLSGIFAHPAEAQTISYQEALMRVHPEDQDRVQRGNETAIANQGCFEIEHRLREPNDPDWRWVLARGTVLVNATGVPAQIVGVSIDISDRKRAELNQQFLSDLDWQLRQQADAEAMAWEVVSRLGAYLQVDRCLWHEIDWYQRSTTVGRTWYRPEVPNVAGTYALDEFFTAEQLHQFEAGQTLIVNDVTTHPGTAPYAQNYLPLGAAAFVSVPCIHSGRWVAVLAVNSRTPRIWRSDEVALLQDIVARLWSIIEQTRSLQALRENEERFRASIETMLDCFAVYRAVRNQQSEIVDFQAEYINDVACLMSQIPREQHLSRGLCELLPGHRDTGLFDEYCQVLETGQPLVKESLIYEDVFGEQRLIKALDIRVAKFGDGYIATWRDITDRKKAEALLQASHDTFRHLVENSPFGVYVVDGDFRLAQVSAGAQKVFANVCPLIGRNFAEVLRIIWTEPFASEVIAHFRHTLETGEPYCAPSSIERRRDTDEVESYDWKTERITLPDGRSGVVCHFYDLSERQQLLQREQAARAEAERANRIKDEFLATLSHELRSPLNPILGWAKLLQTRKFDEAKTTEALATIERNARLQTQLIDDLLDIAKILRGKLNMTIVPVDLVFVIETAIETIRAAAIAKNIHLHPVLLPIGRISGDATRLQQVLWNLLSNAIKFTPMGGRVSVELSSVTCHSSLMGTQQITNDPGQLTQCAQIIVSDTGKGIKPDFLPHIFESFRQEDATTTRQYGGLGLGLSIVRHLVEAHGGTIWADSPGEGQGATFTVRLPLLDPEMDRHGPEQPSDQEPDLTGVRVLTVDDEPDARELLTVLLTQYGAEVLTVASGAEVLANLESFQPDVLVSDIGMPQMDGFVLIRQLRSLPPEKGGQIPAIALTAYAREEDQQQAINNGYQRHLTKPLDLDQFVQVVVELIHPPTFRNARETPTKKASRKNT